MPLDIYCEIKFQQEEKPQDYRISYLETDTLLFNFLFLNQTSFIASKAFKVNILSLHTSVFQDFNIFERAAVSTCSA